MSYAVRYTAVARADLIRLVRFFIERSPETAARWPDTITRATAVLECFPFTCRKATPENPFLRELVIPFGSSGYVALYEIRGTRVDILTIRHQREDDYFD